MRNANAEGECRNRHLKRLPYGLLDSKEELRHRVTKMIPHEQQKAIACDHIWKNHLATFL